MRVCNCASTACLALKSRSIAMKVRCFPCWISLRVSSTGNIEPSRRCPSTFALPPMILRTPVVREFCSPAACISLTYDGSSLVTLVPTTSAAV